MDQETKAKDMAKKLQEEYKRMDNAYYDRPVLKILEIDKEALLPLSEEERFDRVMFALKVLTQGLDEKRGKRHKGCLINFVWCMGGYEERYIDYKMLPPEKCLEPKLFILKALVNTLENKKDEDNQTDLSSHILYTANDWGSITTPDLEFLTSSPNNSLAKYMVSARDVIITAFKNNSDMEIKSHLVYTLKNLNSCASHYTPVFKSLSADERAAYIKATGDAVYEFEQEKLMIDTDKNLKETLEMFGEMHPQNRELFQGKLAEFLSSINTLSNSSNTSASKFIPS